MANREEGAATSNQRQRQEQPQPQDAVRQRHTHLNWSNFKAEFLGKPEEDPEAHLLHSNDWMDAHHFNEDIDTSFSCITLLVSLKGQVLCVWIFVIIIICCG